MRNRLESRSKQESKPEEPVYDDAVISAVGSIAAHFLKENKAKGGSLKIPSLGIEIKADGTEEKIETSSSTKSK